jgi:hypothetical protein
MKYMFAVVPAMKALYKHLSLPKVHIKAHNVLTKLYQFSKCLNSEKLQKFSIQHNFIATHFVAKEVARIMSQTFNHKNCMDGTSTHKVSGHRKPSLKN